MFEICEGNRFRLRHDACVIGFLYKFLSNLIVKLFLDTGYKKIVWDLDEAEDTVMSLCFLQEGDLSCVIFVILREIQ